MSKQRRIRSVVACLLALWCGGARAFPQSAPAKVPKEEHQKKAFAFESRVVKGAPYSAVAIAETVRPLVDGNRISTRTETLVYRDSEGRTRRETDGKRREVFIVDPVARVSHTLFPEQRVAHTSAETLSIVEYKKELMKELVEAAGKSRLKVSKSETWERSKSETWEQSKTETWEMNKRAGERAGPRAGERAGGRTSGGGEHEEAGRVTESLGRRVFEGVEAEGSRTIVTIPAGEVGNDLPIKIVLEQWYAPALQVLVMTRRVDPRDGETTYRLTKISRSEPDPSLFQIPTNYASRPTKRPAPAKAAKPSEKAEAAKRPNKPTAKPRPPKPPAPSEVSP